MVATRRAAKRRRIARNEYLFDENNHISILPDDLLLTILEKLPAENAWRTAQLARSWRYQWRSMSRVNLQYGPRKDGGIEATKFMKFFECHHKGDKLNHFSVTLRYEKSKRNDYKSWLAFALSKNVEELSLEFYIYKYYWQSRQYPLVPLPDNLSECSSLVRLKLTFANLDPLPPFHLVSLKDLHLSKSQISNNGIENITAHCPKLQTLTLSNCNKDQNLKVNVSSESILSKIVIDDKDLKALGLHEAAINAPKITSLEIFASTFMRTYSIVNVADVVEATLILQEMPRPRVFLNDDRFHQVEENVLELLEKLQAVKMLRVCRRCIRTVGMMTKKLKFSLTHLMLDTHFECSEMCGIVILLKACPRLEQLVLNFIYPPAWVC